MPRLLLHRSHCREFPDEYFDLGGWLHESHIKDEQIDFSLVDAKAETLMWQGRSQKNLMGYGANLPLQNGRATIKSTLNNSESLVRRRFEAEMVL